uniref:Leucyl/phenylalanyl-tRNA--protein transferase n=1 Tax=Aureoumbra lagunensis TaxID=44058 RepID=A0A7S3JRD5_9STRA|mmetsp:Transcript_1471/g.2146  ORF Transcript_1471/g.2146 Transcript_1471/m.2146 type:complete len:207 (+) Transcript_1471:338-958(+)
MALRVGPNCYVLLPKLHHERSALQFSNLHVSRSVLRKSSRFAISHDVDFDAVISGIQTQHGDECWLYPPLVDALRAIADSFHDVVTVRTFECWLDGHLLVAGEIGYVVGDIYTSLSGFSTYPSAGSIQCAATAAWLELSGFRLWDLGMELPYKKKLGAHLMSRHDFLTVVEFARKKRPRPLLQCGKKSTYRARELIDKRLLIAYVS